ncbi:sensor histidine kinase [Nocardioides coralli]|uniref:sensor histidine kinase n=1 Tax=Nocardioides coralli TaxID=2872154 RepID=UPI001CA42177|nr:histidine kinase [Nocardioides coralli]QZY28212.1 hypothetical protein K6T13_12050 [Nocardioides coralli]
MRRPGIGDLLWVAVTGTFTAVLVALDPAAGAPEWLYGTVMFTLGGYLLWAAYRAARRAWREHRRAGELAALEPTVVARAAIEEERRRLVDEIGATLRAAVVAIKHDATTLDLADPRPGLARIHRRTQLATTELRRQLGLLRTEEEESEVDADVAAASVVPRRDVWLAAGVAVLAALEVTGYSWAEGLRDQLPWTAVMSAAAAACLVGRTVSPGGASAVCAGVFVLGTLVGAPVLGGFWFVATVGGLLWAVASRRERWWWQVPGALALAAAVAWTRVVDDPENLLVLVQLMVVATVGGLLVRLARHVELSSTRRATSREAELSEAARVAVTAERMDFARDLHDVTSHAIGLIALQAGAAQVSWPRDPDAVRRSVDVIATTAAATLAELDRLGTSTSAASGDLGPLVRRIRAAGTTVELDEVGDVPPELAPVVHRIVQESLTNVVRHAPGAAVRVQVTAGADRVLVRVADDATRPGRGVGRGYGLVGLAERVSLAGGTLRTGPAESGGFVVEASVPVDRAAVTS